jgi:hypothetical protein
VLTIIVRDTRTLLLSEYTALDDGPQSLVAEPPHTERISLVGQLNHHRGVCDFIEYKQEHGSLQFRCHSTATSSRLGILKRFNISSGGKHSTCHGKLASRIV